MLSIKNARIEKLDSDLREQMQLIALRDTTISKLQSQVNGSSNQTANHRDDLDLIKYQRTRITGLETTLNDARDGLEACNTQLASQRKSNIALQKTAGQLEADVQSQKIIIQDIRQLPSCWSIEDSFPKDITIFQGDTWISDDGVVKISLTGFNYCEDFSKQAKVRGLDESISSRLAEAGDTFIVEDSNTSYTIILTEVDCKNESSVSFRIYPTPVATIPQ